MQMDRKIKGEIIGLTHSRPKDLTFNEHVINAVP